MNDMGKFATITLDLYKKGIRAYCEELSEDGEDYEEFIPRGDGQALMDFINSVEDICHPEARFSLTEKGKEEYERMRNAKDNV